MIEWIVNWILCRVLTTEMLMPFLLFVVGPQVAKLKFPVTIFGMKYTITSTSLIVFIIPYMFGISSCKAI